MTELVKCYWGNVGGLRRGVVIARSQKQAAEIAGCSLYEFRLYWSAAKFEPGLKPYTLYTRPYDSQGPWVEGMCKITRHERPQT